MMNDKHILVGIDHSDLSKKALDEAIRRAYQEEATLYITSVIDDNNINVGSDEYVATEEFFKDLDNLTKQLLNNALKQAKEAGVEAKAIFATGNPKHILATQLPEKYQIDLIIVGGPQKDMEHYFGLGSVASYVIRHSPCNVMVVKE